MTRFHTIVVACMAISLVVILSNFAVQYPVNLTLGGVDLAEVLTWGAFTYPVAFLVTDLVNRRFGAASARRVVYVGFIVGVILSIALATPRLAIASGSAFLAAQMLDIVIFSVLRKQAWWRAPLVSTIFSSALDTLIFFSFAFAVSFDWIGAVNPDFARSSAPLLSTFSEAPVWVSWALADFSVKIVVAMLALLPYRLLLNTFRPLQAA